MYTYRASVRVKSASGSFTMVVWAQVHASNPIAARQQLEAQYGRGNVISVPQLTR
jgi:hypothetical protein